MSAFAIATAITLLDTSSATSSILPTRTVSTTPTKMTLTRNNGDQDRARNRLESCYSKPSVVPPWEQIDLNKWRVKVQPPLKDNEIQDILTRADNMQLNRRVNHTSRSMQKRPWSEMREDEHLRKDAKMDTKKYSETDKKNDTDMNSKK